MNEQNRPPVPRTGLSRARLAAPLAIVAAGLPILQFSGELVSVSLLFASGLAAVTTAPRIQVGLDPADRARISVVGLLPASLILLVAMVTSVGLLGGILGLGFFSTETRAEVSWVMLMGLLAITALIRRGRVNLVSGDQEAGLLGVAVLGLGMTVAAVQPFQTWGLAVAGGTDFNRHLVFMKQLTIDGFLDYESSDYPRGLHSLVALLWKASGGSSYLTAWAAFESVAWLMLSLIIMAGGVVTFRLLSLLSVRDLALRVFAWVFLLAAFLQSMWLTAMFKLGFVTSLLAGLIVVAVVALATGSRGDWLGSNSSLAWIALSVAVMAHTWTLLVPPLLALGIVALGIWVRRVRRDRLGASDWLITFGLAALAVAISIPAAIGLIRGRYSEGSMSSVLSTPGYSGLESPEWWWVAATVLAVFTIVRLARDRVWGFTAAVVALALSLVLVSFVVSGAGPGVAGGMNYYALKTIWTLHVIVLPLAVAGLALVLAWAWKWSMNAKVGVPRLARLGVFAVVGAVLLAAMLGRASASRSQLKAAVVDGFSTVPFQPPAISYLESLGLRGNGREDVFVWGVAPSGTPGDIEATKIGIADRLVREGTAWLGFQTLSGGPLDRVVILRDVEAACAYLREYPDAVRITGPNPATGAEWLVAGGCPESVVRPELWIPVELDKEWLTGTGLDVLPYVYPTYDEFQAYLAEQKAQQEAQRNQATPAPSRN